MATNTVEIQVKAITGQAEKGFGDLRKKATEGMDKMQGGMEKLNKEGFTGNKIFGGFAKNLALLGLGAIGTAFSLKGMATAAAEVSQSVASTAVTLEGLGPAAVKNFDLIKPSLRAIARQFGFTEAEAIAAFGEISRVSRDSTVDIDDVAAAMALARLKGLGLAEAARIIGEKVKGTSKPLRDQIGEFADLDEATDLVIERGKEAVTMWQIMGGSLKQLAQDMASAVDTGLKAFDKWRVRMRDNILQVLIKLKALTVNIWEVTVNRVGSFFTETLPNWWNAVAGWLGKVTSVTLNFLLGNLPNLIGAIFNWTRDGASATLSFFTGLIPAWLKRIWDWVKNGIRIGISFFSSGFNIPGFAHGGTVPGPQGTAQLAVVHGGERIQTPAQQRAGAGGGGIGGGGITININNPVVDNETRMQEMADMIFRQLEIKYRRGLNL